MSMSMCEYDSHCCSILSDQKSLTPKYGGVAQLGEHLPCKQGVMGSIPIISTSGKLPQPNIDKASANKYRDGEVKQIRVKRERDTPKNLHGLIAQVVRARA